ncbi:MAG: dTDP-glucose 4,6-dehydratase [Phycisphaerales bacterium]|nr:MAG: dTDP-glucose 4,6-dehydratase [Phycisphaerales bacterium]
MPEQRAFEHLLVTGGCGFIGSNFVRFVLANRPGVRVTNLDALTYSGNPENLADVQDHERYAFVKGDITDAALVRELVEACDAVVNFAAESHVDRSIQDAAPFITSNVLGVQVLLQACKDAWGHDAQGPHASRRFLQVGTDEVYGSLPLDRPDLLFTEQTPLSPSSPYSASKAAADMLALAFHRTFGMDVVVTRCSNNYGPYQFPEKVIPLFVTNLMQGLPVPLYGDGRNVRDWLHVEDHCEAILAVIEGGRAGEVYNIGGNNERSNLELTHAILDIMGMGADMIRPVPDRPGHDRRYAIDAGKMRRELGWQPTRSAWPKGLEDTIRWYQDNTQWWQRVRSGAYRDYYEKTYGSTDTPSKA